jgi:hypothetical protein
MVLIPWAHFLLILLAFPLVARQVNFGFVVQNG